METWPPSSGISLEARDTTTRSPAGVTKCNKETLPSYSICSIFVCRLKSVFDGFKLIFSGRTANIQSSRDMLLYKFNFSENLRFFAVRRFVEG
ncbi:MAG: hypothetical protein VXA48_19180, partial [Deltaproteobacteria bacterium]